MKSTKPQKINNNVEETCQKLAEQLAENELIFDTILETTMAGYWDWDIPNDKEFLSHVFKSMFCYEDHELENHPSAWQNIIHPEDLPKVFNKFEQHVASKGKIAFENEVRYYHKNGDTIWVLCKGKVIQWGENGEPLRMIGCHLDITESKEKEQLYKKQKHSLTRTIKKYAEMAHKVKLKDQVFKEAREISQFGLWSFDLVTKKVEWSEETYLIFGFDPNDEITYEKYLNALHPDHRDMVIANTEKVIASGEKVEFEHKVLTSKGETKYVLATSKSIKDHNGKPIAIRGALQDITSKKTSERNLSKYQKGLETLNKIAANINLSYNEQINEALEKVCKYLNLPLGIVSKVEGDQYQIAFSHSSDPELILENGAHFNIGDTYCSLVLENKNPVAIPYMGKSEYAKHPCYAKFNLESYIGAPVKVNGKIFGTINFSSPRANHKGFSKYDLQFITLLANWVGSTFSRKLYEEELIEAKKRAEEASIAKEQFLSTMSHEIRTPMNAVIGMAHLLLQENPQPHQLEKLKTLRFSAENLLALINDILDFNKIESGKVNFEEIDFSLYDLINGVKHALKFKAQEKNLKLKVKYDDDIPDVLVGDPTRLTQVLINLLGNAIKFTEQGFVSVDLEVVEEKPDCVKIQFTVQDTGIGIPQEKLDLIFERFTQANGDTTRKFGGSGLGLSIIKNLLELQGSKIQVESQQGVGSKFYFNMNFKLSDKSGVSEHSQLDIEREDKNLKGTKILVVEDNKINQMVANEFLGKWQAEVSFADNGLIALEKLETQQFDIILMDLQMPEMDGHEAVRAIKNHQNELTRQTPVIALTASVMADVKDKVKQNGFSSYVSKPFNPTELYSKIRKLIKIDNRSEYNRTASEKSIISFEKIQEIAEGNQQFIDSMCQQLVKDVDAFEQLMIKAIQEKNSTDISFAVHRFKTSLELFSLKEVKIKIESLRQEIENESDESIFKAFEELKNSLKDVKKIVASNSTTSF